MGSSDRPLGTGPSGDLDIEGIFSDLSDEVVTSDDDLDDDDDDRYSQYADYESEDEDPVRD